MDYILRKSYLSNKLPRPLPPPGPERASNLAWMGLQNNLHISPTIVSNSTKHFNGCGSPSRENKQKCSKMTVSNPRVWNTARNTLLTSSFSQDQFHRIVFISTSLHVNRPESGSNFTNPKKVARGQEPEGEAADRVPGGSRGQPWIGWPGKEEGFVLQFRACGAEGGNRQSRPSHRTGGHPRALRLRSPSSRTQDSGLNAEGLGNSHLTENRVPRLPGNRPRCSSLLRADRPPRPQFTPASRPPLGASISHPLLTSHHSDPARWACEYSHPHSLGSLWPFLAAPAKFSLRPPSSPCSRLRDCSIGRAWLCRAARRQKTDRWAQPMAKGVVVWPQPLSNRKGEKLPAFVTLGQWKVRQGSPPSPISCGCLGSASSAEPGRVWVPGSSETWVRGPALLVRRAGSSWPF